MTDLDLLAIGAAVSFIAAGGGYVFMRERFLSQQEVRQEARERTQAEVRRISDKPRRVA